MKWYNNMVLNNMKIKEHNSKIKLVANLSKYTLRNADETISEAFFDYYSNKEKSRTISKEIVKIVKEWF